MNRRKQKKATKQAWHPLTMRVKLRNGKIRKRTCKMGGYSHYAKIINQPISKQVVRTIATAAGYLSLCGGHWSDIKDYDSRNEMVQLGYKPLYGDKS